MSVRAGRTAMSRSTRTKLEKAAEQLRHGTFARLCVTQGLPAPEREYVYAPPRKYRADFAWPSRRLLLEVEGGIYTGEAHGSVAGLLHDLARANAAACHGWRVLRVTPAQLDDLATLALIRVALLHPEP